MGTQITITTDDAALAADLIALINGEPVAAAAATPAPAAKKAAPAKKAAAVVPDPEPEPEDEDVLGGGEPTMADAIARATALVGEGEAARVKSALGDLGVKKVSELDESQIAEFLSAVED